MKHISEIIPSALATIGEPIESRHSELRALQVEREAIQTSDDVKALKAIDDKIESILKARNARLEGKL